MHAPLHFAFGRGDPTYITELGSRTWTASDDAFIVSYSTLVSGDSLPFDDDSEHFVVLPDPESEIALSPDHGSPTEQVVGPALVIVGPGQSVLPVERESVAITISPRNPPTNHPPSAAAGDARVGAPQIFRITPTHLEGNPGQGRIYRSDHLMANLLPPRIGPRDRRRLSPHVHSNYSQASLVLKGEFVHHVRTPWSHDADQWMPDMHARAPAPSVTLMPPGVIHTSEWLGESANVVIDFYSPVRKDLLYRDGVVLNADRYG